MNSTTSANLSLFLAVLAYPLCVFGFGAALGDPAPWVPAHEVASTRMLSTAALVAGTASFIAAMWLSGRAFSAAPKRAGATVLLCIAQYLCAAYFLFA